MSKLSNFWPSTMSSNATAKRTFSLTRYVMNWMRSTMLPTSFNAVSIPINQRRKDQQALLKTDRKHFAFNKNCLSMCAKDFNPILLLVNLATLYIYFFILHYLISFCWFLRVVFSVKIFSLVQYFKSDRPSFFRATN